MNEEIIAKLGPPSKVVPDSLHVKYENGINIIVPYLDYDTAVEFLRWQKGVVDAYSMYPGLKWDEF